MTKLVWYTIKFSLSGVRELELPKAAKDFQNLLESFPHLKNVNVTVEDKAILIQLDVEDLSGFKLEEVGNRAVEEVLETLPVVLTKPAGVLVKVLEVQAANTMM